MENKIIIELKDIAIAFDGEQILQGLNLSDNCRRSKLYSERRRNFVCCMDRNVLNLI